MQELNPLPFLGIVANCTAWLLYGTLTRDPYVYFSNFLGLPLGFFYVFTTIKFANEKVRSILRSLCD
jgi:solute carrier family 50 protein (sugar transporter)